MSEEPPEDAVARNRAEHPRRTPGREPTGWPVTLRWLRITAVVVLLATAALVAVVLLDGGA